MNRFISAGLFLLLAATLSAQNSDPAAVGTALIKDLENKINTESLDIISTVSSTL